MPIPPEAMGERSSNCRSCIGIISSCPHLLQAVEASGGKSPGMKIFAPHPPHETILSGLRLSAATDIAQLQCIIWPHRDKFLQQG
ncbi:MAG: hypothetical protein ACXW3L_02095, partial [Limisphaerales bacterium]